MKQTLPTDNYFTIISNFNFLLIARSSIHGYCHIYDDEINKYILEISPVKPVKPRLETS